MYFCGYSIEEILDKKLPQKLQEHGANLTFLLALYAMLELKGDDSAALVYGSRQDDDFSRGWVEYKKPNGARMVRDYCSSWIEMPYNSFHNEYFPDTERLYLDYIFRTRYTEYLYELIQKPETSYIIGALSLIYPKIRHGKIFGITEFRREHIDRVTGAEFVPTVIENPDGSFSLLTLDLFQQLMK